MIWVYTGSIFIDIGMTDLYHGITQDGMTDLYDAAFEGAEDTLRSLLEQDSTNIDVAGDYGQTPLYVSCETGSHGCACLLLNARADPNRERTGGWTPLHIACQSGHDEIVSLLITFHADVDVADESGYTPLYAACWNGHSACIEVLLSHSADWAKANKGGWTPLHIACQNGHAHCADLLIGRGADPCVANAEGSSPLSVARSAGRLRLRQTPEGQWLVERGARGDLRREVATASNEKRASYLSYL